jgi:hypothetical protein
VSTLRIAITRWPAAICRGELIEQKVREGLGAVQVLRLAALRPWPDENGRYSSARTLEDHWYAWKSGGFAALQPKNRGDEGTFHKLPVEVGQWLLSQKLVAEVGLGKAGIVMGLDLSRLARNCADWHRLLEMGPKRHLDPR